jgi:hypothetical protein
MSEGHIFDPPSEKVLAAVALNRPPISALNSALKLKNTPRGEGKKAQQRTMNAAKLIRKFLTSKRGDAVDEKGQNRFIQITANMVNLAKNPKSPLAVAAYNALMDRAFGKSRPHDDELDAMGKAGIQIVYVAPVELEQAPRKQLLKPKPDFIDAEFTEEE